jgi:intracellular multiplication protein IcmO
MYYDEYGYYAVKGFAVVAAQARSLGFAAVFAGQDLPAFQRHLKKKLHLLVLTVILKFV